tara:strand:- start:5471 stop:6331 length:861 start_codon:yes stop_codon:yes gene_type:complete
MSKIEVDQLDPQSGTNLTIGTSGDTIKSGAGTSLVVQGDGSSANGIITLNCSQNSHGIKLSSPDHSGGQSYTIKFPATNITAGKFLKVDSVSGSGSTGIGQLSFADAGGGSLNLISAQTASSASTLTFTSSHITSTYKVYQLHCVDVTQSADGGNLGFEVSPDNGSSYVQSGYLNIRFYSNQTNGSNTLLSSAGTGDSNVKISGAGEGIGANGNESAQSIITLFNPLGAKAKFFKCDGIQLNSSGQLSMQRHIYGLDQSATYNNIKIVPNSGTFSGTFILYGVTAS